MQLNCIALMPIIQPILISESRLSATHGDSKLSRPHPRPVQPPLESFALLLDTPSVPLGSDRLAISWSGKGPRDVPIKVRGDGLVIFNFDETVGFASPSIPGWQPEYGKPMPEAIREAEAKRSDVVYARLEYMNAWLTAFASGMIFLASHHIFCPPPVDPHYHLRALEQNGRWLAFDSRRNLVVGADSRLIVKEGVFDYAIALMKAAEAKLGDNYSTTLALLHQASHQYVQHQFASAQLLAWTLTEQALHVMWRDFQLSVSSGENAVTEINKERRKTLEGRDYTVSVITQILSLSGRISDERLTSLDTARKARNKFVHDLKPIDGEQAEQALTTAADILSELLEMRIVARLHNTFRS